MCREECSLFELRVKATNSPLHLRVNDISALAGCTFVRSGTLGFESFHFEDAANAYLGFDSSRCAAEGLVLDDGTPMPERKEFDDIHWHAPTRTF